MSEHAPRPDRPDPSGAPDPRPGRTLDLSTGKPPEPKPEESGPKLVPLPAPEGAPEVRAGQTVDFSTGKAPVGRRKPAAASLGAGPVVRETLDLSTATPAPPEAAPPASGPSASGAPPKPKGGGKPRDAGKPKRTDQPGRGRPKPTGNSLADLLDPETLARLRGGG